MHATAKYDGPGVSALLQRALSRSPERIAFTTDNGTLTYGAVNTLIGRLQATLLSMGFQQGQRVALFGGNNPQAWCTAMAAQANGMAVSWLNVLGAIEDHRFQLQDLAADLFIIDGLAPLGNAGQLVGTQPQHCRVLTLGAPGIGTDLLELAARTGSADMRVLCTTYDTALINYTGGTTGRSKGVIRDQHNMGEVTRASLATLELPPQPHFLAVGPISHVTGQLLLPVLLRGGSVRLLDRFSPERVLHTIANEAISSTLLVPTMIYALLDHPSLARYDLSPLKTIIYGASCLVPAFDGSDQS